MATRITDVFVYKWRYALGYLLLAALVVGFLYVAAMYAPGELRQAETASAVHSASLSIENLTPRTIIDLPYHVFQKLFIATLGVSTLSIKLPSIILGACTILGFWLLIRTWFRRNIAVIIAILVASSPQFLFMAQDGTPLIMHSFLAVWLLFFATYVTRQKFFGTLWKVLSCVLLATSLYTPYGIYLVFAIITTMIFHPHVRYIVKRFSSTKLTLALFIGIVATLPIIYASIVDRGVAFTLLGIPTNLSGLPDTVRTSVLDMFGFFVAQSGPIVRPLYAFAFTILMGLGVFKLFTHKYTARSYIMMLWGGLLLPLTLLSANQGTYFFPVGVLLAALGIMTLITDWYKLFPRNPYARVVGLIPLSVVVIGIASSGIIRYLGNYLHNPIIMSHYSSDISILKNALKGEEEGGPTKLVVTEGEAELYTLIANHDKRFTLVTENPTTSTAKIYTKAARQALVPSGEPSAILTNSRAENADRFYIYKSEAK